ncbi:ABC transporter permease [Escherichia albertii]
MNAKAGKINPLTMPVLTRFEWLIYDQVKSDYSPILQKANCFVWRQCCYLMLSELTALQYQSRFDSNIGFVEFAAFITYSDKLF